MTATYPRPGQGSVRDERHDRRIASRGRAIRWTLDGPELQCPKCSEFWPLTTQFWMPRAIYRCLACRRDETRERMARARNNPAVLAEHVARNQAVRRAQRAA